MKKRIILLGATGSIGTTTLEILRQYQEKFTLVAISYFSQREKAIDIVQEFNIPYIISSNAKENLSLKNYYQGTNICVADTLLELLDIEYDIVVVGVLGISGIESTLKAIEQEKVILLANKETIIFSGFIIQAALKKFSNALLLPIDSEHNAIFRLLEGRSIDEFQKYILTASGGPLFGKPDLNLSKKNILNHPTWNMGKKITVDSAGMINKALEIIEAHYLFDIDFKKLSAVIHPTSYVHALVQNIDGSFFMQVSIPNMTYSITYALFYPEISPQIIPNKAWEDFPKLEFYEIPQSYKGYFLGIQAGKKGPKESIIFLSANDAAVSLFLQDRILFHQIVNIIEDALSLFSAYDLIEDSVPNIIDLANLVENWVYKQYV